MSIPSAPPARLRSASALLVLAVALLSCDRLTALRGGSSTSEAAAGLDASMTPVGLDASMTPAATPPGATAVRGGVIGVAGIAAWDGLAPTEKARLKASTSLYLHQSVGQDLEDGAAEVGWKFEYYGPNATTIAPGLNGGLFNDVGPIDNGKPFEKLALVQKLAQVHRGKLSVLAFSFGYADVRAEDLTRVEAEYVKAVRAVRATGARFLHITPPLVYDVAENGPKMKMRTWMLETFAGETIFDLQDIESSDGGKRCELGGVWRICPANRSTTLCPSKGQGVDGDGQGHLCSKRAAAFAKGLLYALART